MASKKREVFMGELAESGELSDREEHSDEPVHEVVVPRLPVEPTVLSTLGDIGEILKRGFNNVETRVAKMGKNVGIMNNNMVLMSNTMELNFTELLKDKEPRDSDFAPDTDSDIDPLEVPESDRGSKGPESDRGSKRRRTSESSSLLGDDEDDGVLSSLMRTLESDSSVGTPLQEPVAKFVNAAFKKPLNKEEVKAKKLKYVTDSNMEELTTPKVNSAIWNKLPTGVKNRDRAWQLNHETFLNTMTAVARATDLLRAHEGQGAWVKEALGCTADALSLGAVLNADWTKTRRDDIRPVLPEDFRRLASADIPPSKTLLFGDDLEASIKSLESHNRLAKKMDTSPTFTAKKNNQGNFKNKKDKGKKKWQGNYSHGRNDSNKSDSNKKDDRKDFRKKGASRN